MKNSLAIRIRRGRERRKERKRASQLNYRHIFLIPRKESRYARADSSGQPRPRDSSLKIEAIYEHNVKSNTMQTLISRARDISPRADRCNISRKRVVSLFFSPGSLCLLALLSQVACASRLRSDYSLRVSVTKLRDLSSNRQRRRRRAKIPRRLSSR